MIKQLVGKKSSATGKIGKEKKLLRWSSGHSKNGNASSSPGDTRIVNSETTNFVQEDTLAIVVQYVREMGFDRNLATKVLRKFRKHGQGLEGELTELLKRIQGTQDAACAEEVILNALPEKNKLRCFRQIYSPLIRNNEFFQGLIRAVPQEELVAFENRLFQSLSREHVNSKRYLAVSPRGALYIVRRGAVRIYQKGALKATLERGSVFEICCLADQYVSIHYVRHTPSKLIVGGLPASTNSPFDLVLDDRRRHNSESKVHEFSVEDPYSFTRSMDADDDDDDDDDEEEEVEVYYDDYDTFGSTTSTTAHNGYHSHSSSRASFQEEGGGSSDEDVAEEDKYGFGVVQKDGKWTSTLSGSPGRMGLSKRRRSLVNAFGLLNRRRSSNEEPKRHQFKQSERDMQIFPWSAISVCAENDALSLETQSSSIAGDLTSSAAMAHIYSLGAELGVISSDNLRAIISDFPNVQRNFDVLSVSIEVQIEKEKEAIRRNQEETRRRLEAEHKLTLNRKLQHACRSGSIEDAQGAITAGAEINHSQEVSHVSPLHLAALFGHPDLVSLLLRLGADLRQKDKEGRTALHLCCLVCNWKNPAAARIVNALVDHETSLFEKDQWGNTPLHLAASTGDLVLIQNLMNHVQRISDQSSLLGIVNQDGFTPLDLCQSLESRRILKPKTHIVGNLR